MYRITCAGYVIVTVALVLTSAFLIGKFGAKAFQGIFIVDKFLFGG